MNIQCRKVNEKSEVESIEVKYVCTSVIVKSVKGQRKRLVISEQRNEEKHFF